MEDPFAVPSTPSLPRQRSRANLKHPLPAPPSSRSLRGQLSPSPSPTKAKSPEMTGFALRQHLRTLLEQKTSQLQMLGQMGQEVLKQQTDLEQRIKVFETNEEDGEANIGKETKNKLHDLDEAMKGWEKENEDMMRELGGTMPETIVPMLGPKDATPVQSALTRRQRNAQSRRTDYDLEFATEIGQNLLVEVRRLQALLTERDRSVQKLTEEKEGFEAERENMLAAIKVAEGNVEHYKEENWNLEVHLQELRSTHADVQDQLAKTSNEHSRLTRSLISTRELAEMHKTDAEKVAQQLEELKSRHETEMAQARKATAGLQRDKSDLVGELNVERQKRINALKGRASRNGSPLVHSVSGDDDEDEDVFAANKEHDSPRKRGPGFDQDGNALSPSALYQSDFDSPYLTPARPGEQLAGRSPLGEMYVNEIDELRHNLQKAQAEIISLKAAASVKAGVRAVSPDLAEFGARSPGGDENEEMTITGGGGRGSTRGRRGRGRGFAASIGRKLGFNRVPSGLSASSTPDEKSFRTSSSGTPDLLRPRTKSALDSPSASSLLDSPASSIRGERLGDALGALSPRERARSMEPLTSSPGVGFMSPPTALSDEMGGVTDTVPSPQKEKDDLSPEKSPQTATAPELIKTILPPSHDWQATLRAPMATPRRPFPPSFAESPATPGEATPTKAPATFTHSRLTTQISPSASSDDAHSIAGTTDTDDFADARSTVGTLTPSRTMSELPTDAETDAYMTGNEGRESQWHTAASSVGSDSDREGENNDPDLTRRYGAMGLGLGAAAAAAGGFAAAKQAHKMASRERVVERVVEIPVDRIVEVPVDRIVEVEKIVEVPVERIVEVEKIVEVPVDRLVEVEKLVEVPREIIVEKIVEVPVDRVVEVDRIVEVPVDRIVEKIVEIPIEVERIVEKIVEVPVDRIVEKIVEVPVEVERIVEKRIEVPVDRIVEVTVEKIVERIVEIPVEVIKEVKVEVPVEIIKERIVEKLVEVERPVEVIVEKIVEVEKLVDRIVEVERIVEKVVEVPTILEVEKVVEKIVEREVQVPKIVEVERIVEVEKRVEIPVDRHIEVERIVEKPIERIIEVEKILEKVVERVVEVIKEIEVEKRVEVPVEVIREVEVERRVEVPVEVVREVEKRVEVPVEVIKEVMVDRIVEVPVEVIREVERIVEKEVEVEKIVERIVEVSVDRIVEKIVEVPIEVIKEVEVRVEVPVEVERIVEVEKVVEVPVRVEVEKVVERIVEVPVEVIKEVEKIVTVPVEVEKIVERVVEKIVEVPTAVSSSGDVSSTGQKGLEIFRLAAGQNFDFLKAPPSPSQLGHRSSRNVSGDPSLPGLSTSRSTSDASHVDGLPSPASSPDKSRPPVMSLPAPPSLPPPAGQGKTMLTGPTRPQSPPPDELLARAITPAPTGAAAPGTTRRKSEKLPPTSAQAAIRLSNDMPPPAPGAASRQTSHSSMKPALTTATPVRSSDLAASKASVKRRAHKVIGGSISGSSISGHQANPSVSTMETMPGKPQANHHGSTDPATIHAITQTMIGEYLYKYTRRTLGKGQSENRHRRFFWIHPYTKTLYWSAEDPGSRSANESSAKSVFISRIRVIEDLNNSPPGLCSKSIILSTPGREIQFTAPNQERHELWMSALQFLLQHQSPTSVTDNMATVSTLRTVSRASKASSAIHEHIDEYGRMQTPAPRRTSTIPQSPMSMHSFSSFQGDASTPKPYGRSQSALSLHPGSSISKRPGTVAYDYIRRHEVPETLHGGHRFKGTYKGAPLMGDADMVLRSEAMDTSMDDSFEGLDNVRACCDGKHVVGGHHHHGHNANTAPTSRFTGAATPLSGRAGTPSLRAWSVKSRRSTAQGIGQADTTATPGSVFGRGVRPGHGLEDEGLSMSSIMRKERSRSAINLRGREVTMSPTPRVGS